MSGPNFTPSSERVNVSPLMADDSRSSRCDDKLDSQKTLQYDVDYVPSRSEEDFLNPHDSVAPSRSSRHSSCTSRESGKLSTNEMVNFCREIINRSDKEKDFALKREHQLAEAKSRIALLEQKLEFVQQAKSSAGKDIDVIDKHVNTVGSVQPPSTVVELQMQLVKHTGTHDTVHDVIHSSPYSMVPATDLHILQCTTTTTTTNTASTTTTAVCTDATSTVASPGFQSHRPVDLFTLPTGSGFSRPSPTAQAYKSTPYSFHGLGTLDLLQTIGRY